MSEDPACQQLWARALGAHVRLANIAWAIDTIVEGNMSIGFGGVLSLVAAILISSASPAQAQDSSWGDLAVSTGRLDFDLNGTGHTYGVAVRAKRHFSPHLALEVGGVLARYCGYKSVSSDECLPSRQEGTTSLFMPEALLQYRWSMGRVSPYVGGGVGLSRRGGPSLSRWDPTFSAAVGSAVYLTDRLGITGEFRLRGHGTRFTGTTSEISTGVVWRFPNF